MNATILLAIHGALTTNPEGARQELMSMGVRPSAVARLAELSAADMPNLAALSVMKISLNYEALAGLHTPTELAEIYLRRSATKELLERVLGLTKREIEEQRSALGIPAAAGRPPVIDEASMERALELDKSLRHLPFADRLLAIHDQLSMWPLSSIYAAIRS